MERSGPDPEPLSKESAMIGTTEIIVIAVIILVLFGASAIPKFARSIGEAKKEFSKGAKEEETEGAGKKGASKKDSDSE